MQRQRQFVRYWFKEAITYAEQAPGETWLAVDYALRNGKRGLSGESSLARLLAQQTKDAGERLVLQEVRT